LFFHILSDVFFQKFEKTYATMGAVVAVLSLLEVALMRWNIVIGGQQLSKSMVGFREYVPPLIGKESVASAVVILILPFVLLFAISRFVTIKPSLEES